MGYLSDSFDFFSDRSIVNVKDSDTDLTVYKPLYFPKKLFLSLTSKCNLLCRHCGRKHRHDGRHISKELLDSIIDDFFPRISAIKLGGADLGEQMLSPHFNYFLERVREYPIDVDLSSSISLISPKNVHMIVSTLSFISISLEGMGKNYESIRGFPWKKFVDNIDMLFEARHRENKKKKMHIGFAVTVVREFKKDYFRLIEFAKEKGIDFFSVRNFIPQSLEVSRSSFLYYPREHNRFFRRLERYAKEAGLVVSIPPLMPTREKERQTFRRAKCSWPFEVLGILPDGKIHPCCCTCFDLGMYTPGREAIMKRWTSDNFVALRKTVNSDNPMPLCRRCEVVEYNPLTYRPQFPQEPKWYEVFKNKKREAWKGA